MLIVGIQLWTDAIWFRSVGFDAVQLDSACTAVHFCPGGCGP